MHHVEQTAEKMPDNWYRPVLHSEYVFQPEIKVKNQMLLYLVQKARWLIKYQKNHFLFKIVYLFEQSKQYFG